LSARSTDIQALAAGIAAANLAQWRAMGSNWTRDFIAGVFGVRVSAEERAAHDAAHRPKPRPIKSKMRYDNVRPLPQPIAKGLLVAMAFVDHQRRAVASRLPPTDQGWWLAIEEQARWERS